MTRTDMSSTLQDVDKHPWPLLPGWQDIPPLGTIEILCRLAPLGVKFVPMEKYRFTGFFIRFSKIICG